LCGRGVSGLAQSHHGASDQEKKESGDQTACEGRSTPEENTNANDGFAAEAIRDKSKRNASSSEPPDNTTQFPQQMLVDYVRVYTKQ
jgi:hypothetical protein